MITYEVNSMMTQNLPLIPDANYNSFLERHPYVSQYPYVSQCFKLSFGCIKLVDQINFFVFRNIFNSKSFLQASWESTTSGSVKRIIKNQIIIVQSISEDGFFSVFTKNALKFRIYSLGCAVLCAKDVLVNSSKATIYTLAALSTLFLISSLNHNMQKNWWKALFDIHATLFCLSGIISRRLTMAFLLVPYLTFCYYNIISIRAFAVNYWSTLIIEHRTDIEEWITESDETQQARRDFFQIIRNQYSIEHMIQTIQETPNFSRNFSSLLSFILQSRLRAEGLPVNQNSIRLILTSLLTRIMPDAAQREQFLQILVQRIPNLDQILQQNAQEDGWQINQEFFTRFADMYVNNNFERAQQNSETDVPFIREKLGKLNLPEIFETEKENVSPVYISTMAVFSTFVAVSSINQRARLTYIEDNTEWKRLCSQYDDFDETQQLVVQRFFKDNFALLITEQQDKFLRLLSTDQHGELIVEPNGRFYKQFFTDLMNYSNASILQHNTTFNALLSQL